MAATRASRHGGQIEIQVGTVIRRLRHRRQLSVRGLADKCGFSPSFISQVELGRASPSIASTERITSALGVTLGEFFRSAAPSLPAVVKVKQRPVMQSHWSRAKIEAVGSSREDSRLEPMMITLKARGTSASKPHAREVEQFAIVFRGVVALHLEDDVHVLKAGDSVSVPAGIRHYWANNSTKSVKLLIVSTR
ncbi:MAG TPA: XRE family transcriptional regulator [Nitrospiraceae bacterium]|nr:XRE family transcriptional regulator [Nitrospiraceae bacterium]